MTATPTARFVLAAEARPAYLNMTALCCWSIRARAGVFARSPISIVFNDADDPRATSWLRSALGVEVSVRPRRSPRLHFLNKLNALDASVPGGPDWTIYLDCDTAVINDLAPLAQWCAGPIDFAAAPVNAKAAWQLDRIFLRHTGLSRDELEAHAHPWFNTRYPYFNGGVFAVRSSRLPEFRPVYEDLTRRLFDQMKSGPHPWRWLRNRWNRKVCKTRWADRLVIGPFFTRYYAEQVALAAAVLKLRLPYRVLPNSCNWKLPDTGHGEESPVRILHYLQSRHPLDRGRLFEGEWIDQYARDPWEGRRELARLVRDFTAQHPRRPWD